MLVLSRRPGEALRIGDELRIEVVSVSNGQVRLGIRAPEEVVVYREEVFERIARANREALADAGAVEALLERGAAGGPEPAGEEPGRES